MHTRIIKGHTLSYGETLVTFASRGEAKPACAEHSCVRFWLLSRAFTVHVLAGGSKYTLLIKEFVSQDFFYIILLRNSCGSFADNFGICGDWHFPPPVK